MPIFDGVDYMWRLDDDSMITAPVHYDVFEFMQKKDIWYGWNIMDVGSCVKSLWETTEQFLSVTGSSPGWFKSLPEKSLYYNNFEISRVALWRSREYQRFFAFLDQSMGIYKHRWGDAPIKTIGVSLFVPKAKIHKFTDVSYAHQHVRTGPLIAVVLQAPKKVFWEPAWQKGGLRGANALTLHVKHEDMLK